MLHHFDSSFSPGEIATKHFDKTLTRFQTVVDGNHMSAIWGAAGNGKSTAIRFAVEQAERPAHYLDLPSDPAPQSVSRLLLEVLTGVPQPHGLYSLTGELLRRLRREQPIIVIDEAQRLRIRAVECIRHLWDSTPGNFPLYFVGGHGCWATLKRHAALRSRLYLPFHFRPMTRKEVVEVMPAYHPIYASADPGLIATVDEYIAQGSFRAWNSYTKTALFHCRQNDVTTFDHHIAQLVAADVADGLT